MDALVTGATGFIGSRLAARLASGGLRVRALARGDSATVTTAEEIVVGDVRSWGVVDEATRDVDTLYHLAAVAAGASGDLWATNVDGTDLLMRACLHNRVRRVVFVSSVAVYKPPLAAVVGEEAATGGVDLYGRSKTAGEVIVREICGRNVEHVILRPCQVYGEGDRSPFSGRVAALVSRGVVPVPRGESQFSLVHIDDLVGAIAAAGRRPEAVGGIFNVAGPSRASIAELAQEMATAARESHRLVPVPRTALRAALAAKWMLAALGNRNVRPLFRSYAADTLHGSMWLGGPEYAISRARDELGFVPAVDPTAGVRRLVEGLA